MSKHPLPALTGIRFLLALWVVIYHQPPPFLAEASGAFPAPVRGLTPLLQTGYSAVTAFFVLSGFVMAYNYDLVRVTSPLDRYRFAASRFSRIYPAYLVGLLLLVPMGLYRIWRGIQMLPPLVEWGGLVLNLTLLQAWIPQTALTWNYPGWSLSDEAFFYACFPFVGALLWRVRNIGAAFTALWILSCIAPLIAVWLPVYHWGNVPATMSTLPDDVSVWANVIRYNPLLRLPEFCAGILLAKLFLRVPSQHWLHNRGHWVYLPAGILTLALLEAARWIPYPLLHNGLPLPLFASLLLGLALGGGWPCRLLSTPLFTLLGNASYAMYIMHVPIYSWLGLFFRYALHRPPDGWMWFGAYVISVILTACIFFKLVEEPLHCALRARLSQWIDRLFLKRPVIIEA